MFDWLGDILSGLGDALSVVFEGVGADIAVDIWNALVEWIYNTVFDAVADLFTSMNNMGAEIFSLSWVNAVVRLFTLFGWALFTVGVAGAVFEVAIESQSGRVSIKGAALNVLKGFFACALIGVLPVELYKFCVSLQNSFAGDLTRIFSSAQGTTIGEIAVFILRAVFRLGTPSEPVLKLSNISYVSASDIASLKFPIWAPLLVLAGISLLGISVIPGIVFIIAGGIWLYYWYQENEKRKKCSILTIRMNSGNNLYFKFNNKTFLKRVTHILANIFNNGTERQVSINIQDCTITGNAQVLTDGVFG